MRSVQMIAAVAALASLTACQPRETATTEAQPAAEAPAATATATAPQAAAKVPTTDEEMIRSAMSAAPAAIGQNATIVAMGEGGMRTLRQGTNNFTCMADNPNTPGPDPMCGDANAMAWVEAWLARKPPPNRPGFMYMLAGGTDASNTDPFATAPTADNIWVETGPHVMVVGSSEALRGYPSGPQPDTKQPYVMWSGTPYAHLMIPVT